MNQERNLNFLTGCSLCRTSTQHEPGLHVEIEGGIVAQHLIVTPGQEQRHQRDNQREQQQREESGTTYPTQTRLAAIKYDQQRRQRGQGKQPSEIGDVPPSQTSHAGVNHHKQQSQCQAGCQQQPCVRAPGLAHTPVEERAGQRGQRQRSYRE